MGEVFRAWDATLRRWVALKVVPKDGTGRAERLLAEARAAAMLKHPNLVSVFDVGEAEGVAFVSMDLVEGRSLRDLVGDASVPMEQRVAWLQQIASAIAAAHRAGVVHRDVKPENVMIDAQGQARVLDFGLAKFVTVDVEGPTEHGAQGPPSFRTKEGRIVGTPAYMAPEQLAGGAPSPSWDQYAFGLLAYELLSGLHPRAAGLIGPDGWAKPLDASVPLAIVQAVVHAMAPSADRRYPSMDALVGALGGPASGASLLPLTPGVAPAGSMPPWGGPEVSSTAATAVPGRGGSGEPVHPTLPTVAHAPVASRHSPSSSRSVLPFLSGVGSTLVVVIALAGVAFWHFREDARAAGTPLSPSAAAPSALATASASAPTAPTATALPAVPVPSSATPLATTQTDPRPSTTSPKPTVSHPNPTTAPTKKQRASLRVNPTPQYDRVAVERPVMPMLPLVQACIDKHPVSGRLPAAIAVTLELFGMGPNTGKVWTARVAEDPALAKCLEGVFTGISFGPPANPKLPAGAIFVSVIVEAP
jgi:serine/threonine-protein kinase